MTETLARLRSLGRKAAFAAAIVAGCTGCSQLASLGGPFASLSKFNALSDEEINKTAGQLVATMDAQNRIAKPGSVYDKRLKSIVTSLQPLPRIYNFKVYVSSELNAFATADGSVRIYSGLMDLLTDDEVRSVIGHEIGHVELGHSAERVRLAALTDIGTQMGAQTVANKQGALAGMATEQAAKLIEQVIHAQFSQSQEESSDDYGLNILRKKRLKPVAAVSALRKLAQVNGAQKSILATHPDPISRARRLIGELREER